MIQPQQSLPSSFRRARLRGVAAVALAALVSACIPGNLRSGGALPAPRTAAGVVAVASVPVTAGAAWPVDRWWTGYGDSQLDGLIDEALAGSPDVAAAAARLRKAAAMAGEAGAALLPTLDGQGSVSESRISLNQGYPDQFKAFLPRGWNDTGEIAASFSFDPDLWGRNKARLAAATSQREAAAIDEQAARLTLAAAVADAYFDLAGLMATRDLRAAAFENRGATRALVADRQHQGLDSLASLRLAETQAAQAHGDLAAAEQAVSLRRHQIAALLGKGPDRGLAITPPKLQPVVPVALPEDATTNLIGRRADIVAARARVEAAAAAVHAARAEFFPAIRISALYGLQALGLGMLFDSDSQLGNGSAAISLPIFHGGALKARYSGARADYESAVADYYKAVVGAYQQLADAVTTRGALVQRVGYGREGLAAAEDALRIAQVRYKAGLANYLDVLTAENAAVAMRLGKVAADTGYRSAEIALIRALGGGYAPEQTRTGNSVP